jgi:hypothetical protein
MISKSAAKLFSKIGGISKILRVTGSTFSLSPTSPARDTGGGGGHRSGRHRGLTGFAGLVGATLCRQLLAEEEKEAESKILAEAGSRIEGLPDFRCLPTCVAGLLDFSWSKVPKRGKIYQITTKYTEWP